MLTDAACKNATCPAGKSRLRLTDSGGLYLEVAPNGSKRWFAKYRFAGKEKRIALGSYPEVPLKAARAARDAARKTREKGVDPVQIRKAEVIAQRASSAITFKTVTEEYHARKASDWSKVHAAQFLGSLIVS
ncbi:Arm DNA-binding domain-containing protein [Roseateles sp.]|uniref:tyrosine-type recombinase/integrase n=1 Tax=Roseateles sp. TaxID=1971397 RepID=UPI0025D29740|nr:Arm DNA-binding domain-containing protein [Roseateles sp.]MBV8035905.1 DUF4102 domain-containing protein [Roseateles sp.]